MIRHLGKNLRIIFIMIMLATLLRTAAAQQGDYIPGSSKIEIPPYLGLVTNMNNEDFMLGVAFLPPLSNDLDLRFSAAFWLRPYGKSVLSRYSENIYFVYKEELYALLLGLDKEIVLSGKLSLFAAAEAALVYKCYRGSDRDNVDVSFPILTAGLGYGFLYNEANNCNQLQLRLGYQYCKMSIYPDRIFVSLLISL